MKLCYFCFCRASASTDNWISNLPAVSRHALRDWAAWMPGLVLILPLFYFVFFSHFPWQRPFLTHFWNKFVMKFETFLIFYFFYKNIPGHLRHTNLYKESYFSSCFNLTTSFKFITKYKPFFLSIAFLKKVFLDPIFLPCRFSQAIESLVYFLFVFDWHPDILRLRFTKNGKFFSQYYFPSQEIIFWPCCTWLTDSYRKLNIFVFIVLFCSDMLFPTRSWISLTKKVKNLFLCITFLLKKVFLELISLNKDFCRHLKTCVLDTMSSAVEFISFCPEANAFVLENLQKIWALITEFEKVTKQLFHFQLWDMRCW